MEEQNITVGFLEKLSKKSNLSSTSDKKKILCILEGQFELKYIIKIFKLLGFTEDCVELTNSIVKVAWGNKFPPLINLVDEKCSFAGGSSIKGSPVPKPAMQAFEMYRDSDDTFSSYSGLIVMFDRDKDKNSTVESFFLKELKGVSIDNCLIVSDPCFESTLIDYCRCGNCRTEMNSIENTYPSCEKFKKKFSSLTCFKSFSNSIVENKRVTSKGLVASLDIDDLNGVSSPLSCIHSLIDKIK